MQIRLPILSQNRILGGAAVLALLQFDLALGPEGALVCVDPATHEVRGEQTVVLKREGQVLARCWIRKRKKRTFTMTSDQKPYP